MVMLIMLILIFSLSSQSEFDRLEEKVVQVIDKRNAKLRQLSEQLRSLQNTSADLQEQIDEKRSQALDKDDE